MTGLVNPPGVISMARQGLKTQDPNILSQLPSLLSQHQAGLFMSTLKQNGRPWGFFTNT